MDAEAAARKDAKRRRAQYVETMRGVDPKRVTPEQRRAYIGARFEDWGPLHGDNIPGSGFLAPGFGSRGYADNHNPKNWPKNEDGTYRQPRYNEIPQTHRGPTDRAVEGIKGLGGFVGSQLRSVPPGALNAMLPGFGDLLRRVGGAFPAVQAPPEVVRASPEAQQLALRQHERGPVAALERMRQEALERMRQEALAAPEYGPPYFGRGPAPAREPTSPPPKLRAAKELSAPARPRPMDEESRVPRRGLAW